MMPQGQSFNQGHTPFLHHHHHHLCRPVLMSTVVDEVEVEDEVEYKGNTVMSLQQLLPDTAELSCMKAENSTS